MYRPECQAGLKEEMKRLGAEHLGTGAHKVAFRFNDDCVVKVARSQDRRALGGVKDEADAFRALTVLRPDVKAKFLPVYHSDRDGWWDVMPYAEDVGTEEATDASADLESDILDAGLECLDLHSENVGFWKGNWRVVDYGFGVSGCNLKNLRRRPRLPAGQRSLLMFGRTR